jgi:hypothetical protein
LKFGAEGKRKELRKSDVKLDARMEERLEG